MLQTYDPPKKVFLGFWALPRKKSLFKVSDKVFQLFVPPGVRALIFGNLEGRSLGEEITERKVVGEHGLPLQNNGKSISLLNPHYRTYTSASYGVVVER